MLFKWRIFLEKTTTVTLYTFQQTSTTEKNRHSTPVPNKIMYVYVILILGFIFNIPFLPATSFTRTFLFWLNDDSILLSVNKKICEKLMFLILSAKFMVTYKNIFKSFYLSIFFFNNQLYLLLQFRFFVFFLFLLHKHIHIIFLMNL